MKHVFIRSEEALAAGVTCNRWRQSQLDTCCSGDKLKCRQQDRNLRTVKDFFVWFGFLWPKHVSLTESHHQFVGFSCNGVMRVQHIKSCKEFGNDRTDIQDNRTSRPRISGTELILWNRRVTIRDLSAALELSKRTVHNVAHECKSPLWMATEFLNSFRGDKCVDMLRYYGVK